MPRAPRFSYMVESREVSFDYDARAYHPEAVYGAALVMTPQCYAYLEKPPRGKARVTLQSKGPADRARLESLAGEFHNELLNHTLRWMVAKHNRRTRDAVVTQALLAARGPRRGRKASR